MAQVEVPPVGDAAASAGLQSDLRHNAIGLTEVIMQGVATIAPAFAVVASYQFAVSQAGLAAPLTYLFAFMIVLLLAISVSQVAKVFPSAGGFYTYIARTVHPRVGFMAGWIFTIWLAPPAVMTMGYLSHAILEPELKAEYGFTLPWWIVVLVGLGLVAYICYQGISLSAKTLVVFGVAEMLIIFALAVTGLLSPGDGGLNLSPFNPGEATSAQGVYLGVVFSIFAFTGWEATTPLAEESRDPKRNVPRGLVGSVLVLGAFLVFCTWGLTVGLGTDNITGVIDSSQNPVFALGQDVWGEAWVIVLFALLNSVLAVSIAVFNATTRLWYAMGRSGSFPSAFARVHPVKRTPVNAILFQLAVSLAILLLMVATTVEDVFFTWSLVITLGLILVYVAMNVGVMRYYLGEARARFNPWLHAVFPIVSSVAVLWVGYKSVNPLPPSPVKYAPIVLAAWLAIGVGVLVALRMRGGGEDWLEQAGKAMDEDDNRAKEPQA